MNKKYFPGANSGEGFFSRFDGIVPAKDKPHYTYILKGGPGVGKSTLMKKIAKAAEKKGYEVEEFRCASDPKSLDAIRVEDINTVVMDGTAPHSIDPAIPGIKDEIVNLGHFKNRDEFSTYSSRIKELFLENSAHYRSAYSLLGAACTLKREAINALREAVDEDKLSAFVLRLAAGKKHGHRRQLFAKSATPYGVVDFTSSFLPRESVRFSGLVGELAMSVIAKQNVDRECGIFYDFVDPHIPHCILLPETAVYIGEGGDTLSCMCGGDLSPHIGYCTDKCEQLVNRATVELAKSLSAHDKIEEIYREYVDYDVVNEISDKLLLRLGL